VVRIADGDSIVRVEEEVAAVVERDDGSVDGLLVVQPEVMLLEPDGKERWKAGPLAGIDESAAVATYKSTIYVAIYSRMATGSLLYGFDRATGKVVWKGEFDQLMVAHSIYVNDTFLSRVDDRLVLRVDESAVSGVQIFSLPDGRRIFSNMHFHR
jgi:outer membrane protein assembly factor BamB